MTAQPQVLVDGRVISHPTAGGRGVGRYTIGLVRAMHESGSAVTVMNPSVDDEQLWLDAIPTLRVAPFEPSTVRSASADTWFMCTQMMLHPIPLDVVPRMITEAGLRVVGVLHDVIPYRYPEQYLRDPSALRQSQLRAMLVRTFDAMVANSTFSADTSASVLKFDRSRIHVVGAAVEPQFCAGSVSAARLQRLVDKGVDVRRGLVVAVTGGDDRKNTPGLIRAWGSINAELRQSHQLVIACAAVPVVQTRWREVAHSVGLTVQDVVFTDTVTDDEMVALYQSARLSVMPSLEEGFGLPVAEAAASGCVTICSNNSSLPEVIDCDEALFNASDVVDIARAIEWALTDEEHRERLKVAAGRAAQRWTWKNVGSDAVAALSGYSPRSGHSVHVRKRIGLMGPSAGSPSGIGTYNRHLVDAWPIADSKPEIVEFIDVSSTSLAVNDCHSAAGMGRYWYPHDVDHLIVSLGSSPYHAMSVARASEYASHVWLHEPTLVGCHVGVGHQSGSREWANDYMRDQLRDCNVPERLWPQDLLDAEAYHAAGIHFLQPVLRRAKSIIVSSDEAAQKIHDIGVNVPILVLPLAHEICEPVTQWPSDQLVVSAGWIDASKCPEKVVQSLSRMKVRLLFVGEASEEIQEQVMEVAAKLGMASRVSFTGRLSNDEYDRTLRSASLAIQLRLQGGRGERSAAVNDLRSRGIPVICDIGREESLSVDQIEQQARELLYEETVWNVASANSVAISRSWTFSDVSQALVSWVDRSHSLGAATIHQATSLG
jgi:glycosyltransferase involved in cell wall biosynthesis